MEQNEQPLYRMGLSSVPMARKRASVFIGSSTEGLTVAKGLQVLLDQGSEVTLWNQGVFAPSQGTLESLMAALDQFDFAILVLTPDDLVSSRDHSNQLQETMYFLNWDCLWVASAAIGRLSCTTELFNSNCHRTWPASPP